jgi:hypothetical protein
MVKHGMEANNLWVAQDYHMHYHSKLSQMRSQVTQVESSLQTRVRIHIRIHQSMPSRTDFIIHYMDAADFDYTLFAESHGM